MQLRADCPSGFCQYQLKVSFNKKRSMEEKHLTERESIELIAAMIQRTKGRLCLGDGNIMLLWGYLTVTVSLLVGGLLVWTGHPAVNWLWFLIMIVGGTLTPHLARKKAVDAGVKSYADTISYGIWQAVGYSSLACIAVCLGMMLLAGKDCWSIMFVFALLLVGFAELVQGVVVKEVSLVAGGAVGMLAGVVTLACVAARVALSAGWFLPMFIAAFVAMMIVPGHVLNHKARPCR